MTTGGNDDAHDLLRRFDQMWAAETAVGAGQIRLIKASFDTVSFKMVNITATLSLLRIFEAFIEHICLITTIKAEARHRRLQTAVMSHRGHPNRTKRGVPYDVKAVVSEP